MVVVVPAGPPPVRTFTFSNRRKVSMVRSRAHRARLPLMLGRVMYQNCWKKPAPSMRAASYWFSYTDWREAYSSRNTKGTFCHTSISRIVPKAVFVSMNQLNTGRPSPFRNWLMMP